MVAIVHHLRCCEARPAWKNRLYRWVEQRYLASLAGFIFNSNATRTDVERLVGSGRPAVIASPGGDRLPGKVNAGHIALRALAPGPFKIICVANLIPRKQVHTLIAALASLPRQDWQLTVAGSLTMDTAYVGSLRRQIEADGLSARISLLGTVSDQDLAVLLPQQHLLAVPSSYEGFGIVYLEGMQFGLPAIAGTDGAAKEIITHGQNGFLVLPGRPGSPGAPYRTAYAGPGTLAEDEPGGAPKRGSPSHLERQRRPRARLPPVIHRPSAHPLIGKGGGAGVPARYSTGMMVRETHPTPGLFKRKTENRKRKTLTIMSGPAAPDFIRYLAAKKGLDDRSLNRHVWDRLVRSVGDRQDAFPLRVLEVGCGIGTMLERLLDWGLLTRAAYTGIDVEPEFIRAAAARCRGYAAARQASLTLEPGGAMLFSTPAQEVRVTFEAADLFDFLDRAPGKSAWDLLVAHAVLDLIDLPTALPRLLSRLAPGGLFYFTLNFDGVTASSPSSTRTWTP